MNMSSGRRASREKLEKEQKHHGGTSVEIRHAFGSQCHASTLIDWNHAGFLDPNYVIAPVGLHIGIRNVQNKDEVYFLQQSKGIEGERYRRLECCCTMQVIPIVLIRKNVLIP